MDKVLMEMKHDFENYLNKEHVFSDQEKRRIINHVKYTSDTNSRRFVFPKIISSVTLVSLCALIIFLILNFIDAGEKSQPANLHKEKTVINKEPVKKDPVKALPKYTDKEILNKAIFLQSTIAIGMAEKEVINLLGNDYVEIDNSDSESGSVKQIGYNFLVSDSRDQQKISNEIDSAGILNRDIGVQFCIGFSNQFEVLWTTISFAEGDSVYMMSNGMNGREIQRIYTENNSKVIRFSLTPEEEVIYQQFLQDMDEKHLKDIDPLSIAKLYVQATLDKRYDAVYTLYTDREGFVQWTKEEDERIPEAHRGTLTQTLTTFNNISTGNFILDGENDGFIEYEASENADVKSGFKMVRDEDGIWKVAFSPIQ